jgi:transcriptional regulator with GAF, ATPase, and Fis domain
MATEVWHESTAIKHMDAVRDALRDLRDGGVAVRPLAAQAPHGDGLLFIAAADTACTDALRRLSRGGRHRIIVVQVAGPALRSADHWRLLRSGASEVLVWPQAHDPSHCIAARLTRWREVDAIVDADIVRWNLVGESPSWRSALRRIVETACFTDAPVLVTGESGTGKELVARLIHSLDRREDKGELVLVDCTTLVPELVGSELFGHERGAFTGALAARDGACALADKGTLFLDEIGELPALLQPQLLRVIQEKSYKRVGGNRWSQVQFRLVCATNRRFDLEIAAGRFRADLYYRIANCIVTLPTLAERGDDKLRLAQHFLAQMAEGHSAPTLSEPVRDLLMRRHFPGNVRELRQFMSRICTKHSGNGLITVGDVPEDEWLPTDDVDRDWRDGDFERAIHRALALGAPLKDLSQHTTDTAIRLVVDQEHGNLQRAARRLGMTDRALQIRRAQHRSS